MIKFMTPGLLITDYYDSLISQLDIYTDTRIKEIKEKCRLPNIMIADSDAQEIKTNNIQKNKNPYKSQRYSIDRNNIIPEIRDILEAEDYLNKMRQKAIDEIRKAQDENLEYYKPNKEKLKVDKENLTEEKLEELKSQLFANRFCFFLKRKPFNICKKSSKKRYCPLFELQTVITDFYLRESDIDYIRGEMDQYYEIIHPSTKFDQRFFVANQLLKYIKETLDGHLNGYEVIQVKQKILLEIEHIKVDTSNYYDLSFKETDFSSFDIDLSPIKSLSLKVNRASEAKLSDLSAFVNLEYLSICGVDLCQSPFRNLHKLIKLKISNCDLIEFDFDSLNSITSLEIINIYLDPYRYKANIQSDSFKIYLSRLINLKIFVLNFNIENENEKLVINSNQLNEDEVNNKTIDSPELKCLDISTIDLSKQINTQWFNGLSSLMELHLNHTNLKNVDFLDTDRLGNLEILSLSENQIRDLKKGVFSKLKKLKKLNLYDNLIIELIPGVFEGLDCLKKLDIRSNNINIGKIDKSVFDELKCLKGLYIKEFGTRFINVDYLKRDGLNVY